MDIERAIGHYSDHTKKLKEFNNLAGVTVKNARTHVKYMPEIYNSQDEFNSWLSTNSTYEVTYR